MKGDIFSLVTLVACLVALTGCSRHDTTLGKFEIRTPVSLLAAANEKANTPVNVTGKLVEKCPVAGCWFYLQDETGRLKVDTKNGGFVVLDVPLGTRVEVSGNLLADGANRLIDARGLRF